MKNSELLNEINKRLKRIEDMLKPAERERHWSELNQPTGDYNYSPSGAVGWVAGTHNYANSHPGLEPRVAHNAPSNENGEAAFLGKREHDISNKCYMSGHVGYCEHMKAHDDASNSAPNNQSNNATDQNSNQ